MAEHLQPLSTTAATLPAFLLPLEVIQTSAQGVGLYFGRSKAPSHQDGTIYLTSHRLIFVSSSQPLHRSGFVELSHVREITYYARFLKSSPKITLEFRARRSAREGDEDDLDDDDDDDDDEARVVDDLHVPRQGTSTEGLAPTWVCTICGFSNSLTASPTPNCQLCGVARKPGSEPSSSLATPTGAQSPLPRLPSSNTASSNGLSCPVCTFENHPSMSRCEMCDTDLGTLRIRPSSRRKSDVNDPLPASSSQTSLALTSSRPSTPPVHHEVVESMKLSFRKGGDKAFYAALKASLRDRAWRGAKGGAKGRGKDGSATSNGTAPRKVGIDGIISAVDGQARNERQDMDDALQDLETLMGKAKRMVELAESLNAKLARQEAANSSTGDSEAATAIRSSLLQLGLQAPAVTADMARNEASYHRELARELAGVLLVGRHGKGGIMGSGSVVGEGAASSWDPAPATDKGRGILGLDEVWCAWNRARGVALVPPQALRSAALHLHTMTKPPIQLRTLRSGLVVLHTPRYEPSTFARRILALLEQRMRDWRAGNDAYTPSTEASRALSSRPFGEGMQTLQVARVEGANPALTTELLEDVEMMGLVVRDEGAPDGAVRWFPNLFDARIAEGWLGGEGIAV